MEREFNLTALANALPDRQEFFRLKKQIARTSSLYSILADLNRCENHLVAQALRSTERDKVGGDIDLTDVDAAIDQALIASAIILYARSTDSSSKRKSGIDVRTYLKENEQILHSQIMRLRNEVIAHADNPDQPGGVWFEDRLALRLSDKGASIHHHWVRANYRPGVPETLTQLLQRAKNALDMQIQSAVRQLHEEMGSASKLDGFDELFRAAERSAVTNDRSWWTRNTDRELGTGQ